MAPSDPWPYLTPYAINDSDIRVDGDVKEYDSSNFTALASLRLRIVICPSKRGRNVEYSMSSLSHNNFEIS